MARYLQTHRATEDVSVLHDRIDIPGLGFAARQRLRPPCRAAGRRRHRTQHGRQGLRRRARRGGRSGRRAVDLAHPSRPRPHGRHPRAAGGSAAGPAGDDLRRDWGCSAASTTCRWIASTCSIPARTSTWAIGSSPASGRRSSTARSRRGSWTARPVPCSRPTASAHRCATPDLADSESVATVPADDLRAAQLLWASVDSPWVHYGGPQRGGRTGSARCARWRRPSIFSTHLPPAVGGHDAICGTRLLEAPDGPEFVGARPGRARGDARDFEPA